MQYERCSFDVDIEHCPNCGGALKIIAAIEDPLVIVKILAHLGLPSRAVEPHPRIAEVRERLIGSLLVPCKHQKQHYFFGPVRDLSVLFENDGLGTGNWMREVVFL